MAAIRRPDRDAAWWVSFRYAGQRVRRKSPVQSAAGAAMYERVLRRRFLELEDRGIDPFSVRTATFGDLAARWMKEHVEVRNRASTRRAKTFALRLHLLPTLQDIPSHKVTSKDIDRVVRLMSEQKLSGKTINNNLSMLRTCLSWGQRRGLVDRVPETPGMPVTEPRYSFLSPDEARQLIAATNSQYWKTLLLFLLHTGCRIGEASALEWSAVELDGPAPRIRILQTTSLGVVGPTKNGRHREIPLSAELLGALRTLPHGSRYVFGLNDGSLLQSTQSAKRLHRICRRAGLKRVSWHALRHTFATELSTRRVPLRAIQELLGHASLAMTARYAHVTDGALQTAVATLPAYSSEV